MNGSRVTVVRQAVGLRERPAGWLVFERGQQTLIPRIENQLEPALDIELLVDVVQMHFDGALRHTNLIGDFSY